MKKIILLLLCLFCFDSYSQTIDLKIEQSAVNFLGTNILPKEKKISSFRYDGKITHGNRKLESAISTMWMFPFCKQNDAGDRKEAGLPVNEANWNKIGLELEKQLRNHPIDSTLDYSDLRLIVPKELTEVSKQKHRAIRHGLVNHYWRKWRYSLLGSAHFVRVFNAIEFDELYLVYIDTHATHDTAGLTYYILLDKKGKVTDWCRTTWIS